MQSIDQSLTESIRNTLQNATQKNHINLALNQLLEALQNHYELESDDFIQLFRDKIYELVFLKGDILDRPYICLYSFTKIDSKIDSRFDSFIQIADNNLFSKGIGDEENIMLLELGSVARILSGRKTEGLKYYIKNICLIDMMVFSAQKAANFILQAFEFLEIPFEIFIEAMQEVLEENTILALDARRIRSVFNWQLQVFWNVKHFFNHRDWLKLYPLWLNIFYKMLDSTDCKKIDEALYIHFFIYHMCGNSFTSQKEWKEFNQSITQRASKTYIEFSKIFSLPKPTPKSKPKKIIAFLRDRFVENSPYKVEYSFLKTLIQYQDFNQNYEIRIYSMGILEKSDDDETIKKSYKDLGIKIIDVVTPINQDGYYNSHLTKALNIREAIIKDNVDILISPNNGYGISDFILATRTAPKQIFWSHGNFVYDIKQLDLKITHICSKPGKIIHEGYEFIGISVEMEQKFYNPFIPKEIIEQEKSKYPKEKIILGVIGRLTKIDSNPYLKSIVTIMQNHPNTIFLGCGVGNTYEIKQKISAIDPEILPRFFFPGYIDSAIYGHIIDFWLDSFPMEQGESKVEYNAKGGIILNLSKESKQDREKRLQNWVEQNLESIQAECKKENITLEFLKKILIEDTSCIAFDEDDYIKKTSNLLALCEEQKQILTHHRLLNKKIYNNIRKNEGLQSFLKVIQDV